MKSGQNLGNLSKTGIYLCVLTGAYYMIEAPFPSLITFAGDDSSYSSAAVGESGYYTVNVLDPDLEHYWAQTPQASTTTFPRGLFRRAQVLERYSCAALSVL